MPDRRWVCGLMRELQDWDQVITSERYLLHVHPVLEKWSYTCKDWPDKPEGMRCGDCGFGIS